MTRVGLSFHPALLAWLDCASNGVECIEVLAERFWGDARGLARVLRARYPLVVRSQTLSLASVEADESELTSLASFVSEMRAPWVSDHLGFRYAPGIDFGGSCPIVLNGATLDIVADRARRVMEACGTLLLIRNLASPLVIRGSLSESEFLNRLCELAGCGISLDATALLVNARNHRFDPRGWLDEVDRSRVVHVHAGGCREVDGRWDDMHDTPIDDELWALLAHALVGGAVEAITLQWEARFPPSSFLEAELRRLKALVGTHEPAGVGK